MSRRYNLRSSTQSASAPLPPPQPAPSLSSTAADKSKLNKDFIKVVDSSSKKSSANLPASRTIPTNETSTNSTVRLLAPLSSITSKTSDYPKLTNHKHSALRLIPTNSTNFNSTVRFLAPLSSFSSNTTDHSKLIKVVDSSSKKSFVNHLLASRAIPKNGTNVTSKVRLLTPLSSLSSKPIVLVNKNDIHNEQNYQNRKISTTSTVMRPLCIATNSEQKPNTLKFRQSVSIFKPSPQHGTNTNQSGVKAGQGKFLLHKINNQSFVNSLTVPNKSQQQIPKITSVGNKQSSFIKSQTEPKYTIKMIPKLTAEDIGREVARAISAGLKRKYPKGWSDILAEDGHFGSSQIKKTKRSSF